MHNSLPITTSIHLVGLGRLSCSFVTSGPLKKKSYSEKVNDLFMT